MPQSRVDLFVPCLVDQVCPEIGLAVARVLQHFGYEVRYDSRQTCCGQPAFNAGHQDEARRVAENFLDVFADCERVVCPSGSCTAMVRRFFPDLFAGHARLEEAKALGNRVFEFAEFLVVEGILDGPIASITTPPKRVGLHNSCHSLRELGLGSEAATTLRSVNGCQAVEPPGPPVCCGFGGLFSVKFSQIAESMAQERLRQFSDLDVDCLVSNDPGCILHLRQESPETPVRHLAEFLAELLEEASGKSAGAQP